MPNFPIYRGELPEVLHPLNLRHYWLLAYWIYFRPTAFHCYLNAADPHLYQLSGFPRFWQSWRVRAYRHVYLMLPIASTFLVILATLTLILYTQITFQGSSSWVNAIAITPNGQTAVLATGARDLTIKVPAVDSTLSVVNLRWGSQMRRLKGHVAGVTAVAVTPDGKLAVSASRDYSVRVWDIKRGKQLRSLESHKDWIPSIAITPDGKRIISASADKTLKIWDIQQGTIIHTLTGHTDVILSVVVTSDGSKAISASADKTLKVWDLEQGTELYTLKGHSGWVTGVALTPDGQQIVSASADKTLKIWDLEQGKELYTLKGHKEWITGLAVSPDGQQVVSASTDKTLKIWDIEQGKTIGTLKGHNGWVTSIAITRDGKQAVSASTDNTLKVWDLNTFEVVHTLIGHPTWVTAIALLPNKLQVLSASFKGYPKLWSLKRGKELPMPGMMAKAAGLQVGVGVLFPLAVISAILTIALILAVGVMAFGITGSILSGLVPVFLSSVVFSIAFVATARVAADPMLSAQYNMDNTPTILTVIFGILLGVILSVIFGLTSRPALGFLTGFTLIMLVGIAAGIIIACLMSSGISLQGRVLPAIRAFNAVSFTFNLLVAVGTLRILFYPVQFVLGIWSWLRGKLPPAVWDELLVLPVPGTREYLQAHLLKSEPEGLSYVAEVVRNPFQRAYAQRALHTYLHSIPAPLHFLYHLLTSTELNTYVVTPMGERDWQLLPTTKQVLLGEIANQKVDYTSDGINCFAENRIWSLTKWLRNRKHSSLTRFADLLYKLAYTKLVEAENFNLSNYEKIYAGLTQYPGGMEIADSFEVLATFLSYKNLSDLTGAGEIVSILPVNETAIRPQLLEALTWCGEIGDQAIAFQASVTPIQQQAILAQMVSNLDKLDEYVIEQVVTPEQAILRRIMRQWRQISSKAVGAVC